MIELEPQGHATWQGRTYISDLHEYPEIAAAARFLYLRLTEEPAIAAAVGNRIYMSQASQGAQFPYLVYSHQWANDRMGQQQIRFWSSQQWWIRLVDTQRGISRIARASRGIDRALGGRFGLKAMMLDDEHFLHACYREWPYNGDDELAGQQVHGTGGFWRLQIELLED